MNSIVSLAAQTMTKQVAFALLDSGKKVKMS
jgi:hypothetical protein